MGRKGPAISRHELTWAWGHQVWVCVECRSSPGLCCGVWPALQRGSWWKPPCRALCTGLSNSGLSNGPWQGEGWLFKWRRPSSASQTSAEVHTLIRQVEPQSTCVWCRGWERPFGDFSGPVQEWQLSWGPEAVREQPQKGDLHSPHSTQTYPGTCRGKWRQLGTKSESVRKDLQPEHWAERGAPLWHEHYKCWSGHLFVVFHSWFIISAWHHAHLLGCRCWVFICARGGQALF